MYRILVCGPDAARFRRDDTTHICWHVTDPPVRPPTAHYNTSRIFRLLFVLFRSGFFPSVRAPSLLTVSHVQPQPARTQRVGKRPEDGGRVVRPRTPRNARAPEGRADGREPAVLRHGRVLLSPRVPGGRGQASRGHQSQDDRRRQAEKSQGDTVRHAAVRSHFGDFVSGPQGQRRLRDDHRVSGAAQHPQNPV